MVKSVPLTTAKVNRTLLHIQRIQNKVHVALDDNGGPNAQRNRAVHVQPKTGDFLKQT